MQKRNGRGAEPQRRIERICGAGAERAVLPDGGAALWRVVP
ncbi:hypothetical protein [Streptomonospora sediminis]